MTQAPPSVRLETWKPPQPPKEDDAEGIIGWAADRFQNHQIVMTTSFGMEGVVLLHMLVKRVPDLRVIYVDTGFLFPETLRLRDKLSVMFPDIRFDAVHPLVTPDEQAEQFQPELWKHDSELCCKVRKVEPLYRAIQGVDVWFTSVRRDQSPARWNTKVVDWNWMYQLLKVCPLVTWTRQKVYDYITAHRLPYNELHDQSYPTVGCTHCTSPVPGAKAWEYSRKGRWEGTERTECGLHGDGI